MVYFERNAMVVKRQDDATGLADANGPDTIDSSTGLDDSLDLTNQTGDDSLDGVTDGIANGITDGVGSVVNGVNSSVGAATAAIGNALQPNSNNATSSQAEQSTSLTAIATTAPASSTSSSTSLSLTTSNRDSSATSIASATSSSLISGNTDSIPTATTSLPFQSLVSSLTASNAFATTGSITGSGIPSPTSGDQAAAAESSHAPQQDVSFLQNKPLVAGVFSAVGVVVLVLLFIASTWCIRRRRRDRLEEEAVDFSPTANLIARMDDQGYPDSLRRSNSGASARSGRYGGAGSTSAGPYATAPQMQPSTVMNAGRAFDGVSLASNQTRNYAPSFQQNIQRPFGAGDAYPAYGQNPLPVALRPGLQGPPSNVLSAQEARVGLDRSITSASSSKMPYTAGRQT